jgi:hypothetical protein
MNISYTILYWDNSSPMPIHAVYNTVDGSFTMVESDSAPKPVSINTDGLRATKPPHLTSPSGIPHPTPTPPSKESIIQNFAPLGYMHTPFEKTW